jgi:imidazolonepropionase-like amidohydrolase
MVYEKKRTMEQGMTGRAGRGQEPQILSLEPNRGYLIRARGIVPRAGTPPIFNGILAVRDGLIQAVEAQGTRVSQPLRPGNWEHIDLGDAILFPALVDSHVHLGIPPSGDPAQRLVGCLTCGIGGVRDAGDAQGRTIGLKRTLGRLGVRIAAAGWALCGPGGYGRFLGRPVADPGQWLRELDDLVNQGADLVKIIVSGIVDFRTAGLSEPLRIAASDLACMVAHARERGLRVAAHANTDAAVQSAVRAGVQSVEHGYLMQADSVKMMADCGTCWTPTLLPVRRLGASSAFLTKEPPHSLENLRRIYGKHEENVALAHGLGVRITAGTDAGAPGIEPGASLYEEMGLLVRAGLPAQAALLAGTLHGGELVSDRTLGSLGALEPGRCAHILALAPSWKGGIFGPGDIRAIVKPVAAPTP